MQAGLDSPLRKLAVVLACLLLLFLYTARAWRTARAAWVARSQQLSGFELAAALEPGNAEHQQSLGRYSTLVLYDLPRGRSSYEAATSLNPYKGRYWLDLALVHQLSGDVQEENRAIERALQAEPTSLNVTWEAANLYVVQGNWELALPLFRVVLQRDPTLRRQALELAVRGNREVNELLERAVPPSVPVYVDFLNLLVRRKDTAGAGAVWSRLMALGEPVAVQSALPYLNLLLAEQQGARARQAWQDLARIAPALSRYIAPGNLVSNSGFEEEMLGNGLDWRVRVEPGTQLAVDEDQAHSGNRSLRIRFEGASFSQANAAQLIPVQPATSYRLVAYVKSDGVAGVNGPRFQILETATGAPLLLSDEVSGSEPWRSIRGEFTTGPQTQLVTLRVVRIPPLGQVRGTLWLDDVRIESTASSAPDKTSP
ncbi:MAG: carbohydrate binding domain-containing protein [Terriglobales bacterium]